MTFGLLVSGSCAVCLGCLAQQTFPQSRRGHGLLVLSPSCYEITTGRASVLPGQLSVRRLLGDGLLVFLLDVWGVLLCPHFCFPVLRPVVGLFSRIFLGLHWTSSHCGLCILAIGLCPFLSLLSSWDSRSPYLTSLILSLLPLYSRTFLLTCLSVPLSFL